MNKPGHLSVRWTAKYEDTGPGTIGAKLGYPDHGDLLFQRGRGVASADGGFACYVFHQKDAGYGKTFAEELHARGYDLRTLKFSIKKRTTESATSLPAGATPSEEGKAESAQNSSSVTPRA